MRSAGNFHPEWGYLAPAPSFMRTARIALVATAIGATAGAVVVVSLLDRPGSGDDTSIAAHALVTSAPVIAAPPATASPAAAPPAAITAAPAPAPAQPHLAIAPTPAPAGGPAAGALVGANKQNVTPAAPVPAVAPASVAALDETAPAAAVAPAPVHPDTATSPQEEPAKKFASKKRRPYEAARRWQAAADARKRWQDNRGFAPLFRLFSFRTGSSSYPN